jgi:homoserine dehydrogenase
MAVAQIYRRYRDGARVVAVVSAYEGVTDTLWSAARHLGEEPHPATLAALVSTGEIASATQLTLALHQAGLAAQYVDPREFDLTASGDRGNATLVGLGVERLRAHLAQCPVLVIPGFFARSVDGGLALLGRGGSDFTALYLADALRAQCVLLKDVEGLYEADPATSSPPPRRFLLADYAAAETFGGPLVQAKAVRFARERALSVEVAKIGSGLRTKIGEGPTILSRAPSPRRIRVALLGLGTVGGGVYEYLTRFPERFEVVATLVRTPAKHLARGIPGGILTDSPSEVFSRHPEIRLKHCPAMNPPAASSHTR